MAINKKLIHFKTKENFNKEVAKDNILSTSICFIQDSHELYTHDCIYKTVNWSILDDSTSIVEENTLVTSGQTTDSTFIPYSGRIDETILIL